MAKYEKVYVLQVFNVNGVLIGETDWQRLEPKQEAIEEELSKYIHAEYAVIEERFRKL
jgi:hypothetical protein